MLQKIKYHLKSKVHRKVLLFFIENERSIDTPRGIATWTNENIQKVTEALEELAAAGILKAHRTSSTVGYSCALNKKEQQILVSELNP